MKELPKTSAELRALLSSLSEVELLRLRLDVVESSRLLRSRDPRWAEWREIADAETGSGVAH